MRSAHAGNIANNAYLIAKFLRRKGEDAHAFHFRSEFIMGHPEWEDADFTDELDPFDPPDWSAMRFTNGYVRPEWVHYISGLAAPYTLPRDAPGGRTVRLMAATYSDSSAAQPGGLTARLRAASAALAGRYQALARQGQLRANERLQLWTLGLVREAVEWASFQRAERRMFLNPWVFAPRYAHHTLPFAVLAAAYAVWFLPHWLYTRLAARDRPPHLHVSKLRTALS